MKCFYSLALIVVSVLFVESIRADDWTRFRGPRGAGVGDATSLPETWSSNENVVWRTKLPGPGTSSPIVLGERIYLTSYSGYGIFPRFGDQAKLKRHVLSVDRQSGKIVWDRKFEPALPESKYSMGNDSQHGYASSTPTTDGERLYVFFGKSGVYCMDLDGQELWHANVGSKTTGWGSSNSPVLFENLVIINASVESDSLVALDKLTGEEVWRSENIRESWNTPVFVNVGKTQELVVSESEKVLGFDPATGKVLWHVGGFGGYVCPSAVVHDDVVYVVRGKSLAVRAGGRGDVTDTHVIWRAAVSSVVPSPVYHDGHLYWVRDSGVAHCLDAATGKKVYQKRLSPLPGTVYASLVIADGKLYCASQGHGAYVLAAEPEFKQLALNLFDDDASRTNASPVVHNGQLLLRTDRYLYCIGLE